MFNKFDKPGFYPIPDFEINPVYRLSQNTILPVIAFLIGDNDNVRVDVRGTKSFPEKEIIAELHSIFGEKISSPTRDDDGVISKTVFLDELHNKNSKLRSQFVVFYDSGIVDKTPTEKFSNLSRKIMPKLDSIVKNAKKITNIDLFSNDITIIVVDNKTKKSYLHNSKDDGDRIFVPTIEENYLCIDSRDKRTEIPNTKFSFDDEHIYRDKKELEGLDRHQRMIAIYLMEEYIKDPNKYSKFDPDIKAYLQSKHCSIDQKVFANKLSNMRSQFQTKSDRTNYFQTIRRSGYKFTPPKR